MAPEPVLSRRALVDWWKFVLLSSIHAMVQRLNLLSQSENARPPSIGTSSTKSCSVNQLYWIILGEFTRDAECLALMEPLSLTPCCASFHSNGDVNMRDIMMPMRLLLGEAEKPKTPTLSSWFLIPSPGFLNSRLGSEGGSNAHSPTTSALVTVQVCIPPCQSCLGRC